ncbi:hypothetical protein OG389_20775 [Streptomyces sp. NBC_00435]|uniref:hypothetical protein n=1 Tax=Streptomyces sp. NBC_00435 TaxID=2903649 RepID=UPI002E23027E
MRTRALARALTSLLAVSALTVLVPAATASAANPTECTVTRASNTTNLLPGQRLNPGASLVPTPGKPELVMQPDGNLVVYAIGNPGGPKLALWHSGTYGNPGAYALMQDDGNFVVYKKGGGPDKGGALWATGTYGSRTDRTVQASFIDWGELTVTGRSDGNPGWRSGTMNQHAMICSNAPGRIVPIWEQGNWAQSASVWLVLQKDNNLVMYRKRDGKAIWSSGTYGAGNPSAGNNGALYMEMLSNGDLALREYSPNYTIRWHTGTAGSDAYALLQDDGNLVVYKKGGGPGKGGALWATGTYNQI